MSTLEFGLSSGSFGSTVLGIEDFCRCICGRRRATRPEVDDGEAAPSLAAPAAQDARVEAPTKAFAARVADTALEVFFQSCSPEREAWTCWCAV